MSVQMSDEGDIVSFNAKVHATTLRSFREGILVQHGTLYGKVNGAVEEALKLYARIMKGEVKPPK